LARPLVREGTDWQMVWELEGVGGEERRVERVKGDD